jgi:hypothetical protein
MFCDRDWPPKSATELKRKLEIDVITALTVAHSAKCRFVTSEQQAGSSWGREIPVKHILKD